MFSSFTQSEALTLVNSARLSTRDDLRDIEAFFADKDTRAYDQMLRQRIETVEARVALIERDSEDLRTWLVERGYITSDPAAKA